MTHVVDYKSVGGRRCACWAIALVAVACSPSASGRHHNLSTVNQPPLVGPELRGRARYEARHATDHGLSLASELRPIRGARLDVLGPDGQKVGRAVTGQDGAFTIPLNGPAAHLVLWANAPRGEGRDLSVTVDRGGRRPHGLHVGLGRHTNNLDIIADDAPPHNGAGAFHILDTLLRGVETAEAWTGQPVPPIFVFWGRGVTRDWSYYHGEVPRGSGRYSMELLGGEPGTAYVASDTDEHDEVILLHELGHLVMDLMSARSSYGGRHPPGVLLDPGLAWEEGRVSWFATAVLGNSLYRDTVGFEPRGSLRVDRDYAQTHQGPQGMGSEETVAEILWDLADGTPGLPDDDNDGVALGPVVLMQAMMDLADLPEGYPSLPSFLRLLVSTGRVEERDLQRMLAATGQPDDLVPPQDRIPWPMELTVPGKAWGTVDGLSQPCPSGGAPSPRVGQDAVKVYRFHLSEPDVVDILVRIYGTGRRRERQDLDLELRDARTRLLHSSRTQRRQERLRGISLPAGWYVMIVRDAGQGNRARYDVRISSHRVHR